MRDLKTYLSVAPVLSTLWFGALAGLLKLLYKLIIPMALATITFPTTNFLFFEAFHLEIRNCTILGIKKEK